MSTVISSSVQLPSWARRCTSSTMAAMICSSWSLARESRKAVSHRELVNQPSSPALQADLDATLAVRLGHEARQALGAAVRLAFHRHDEL